MSEMNLLGIGFWIPLGTHGSSRWRGMVCASSRMMMEPALLCSLRAREILAAKRLSRSCTLVVTKEAGGEGGLVQSERTGETGRHRGHGQQMGTESPPVASCLREFQSGRRRSLKPQARHVR